MTSGVRVVHMAAYGGSYPGSFIPMLEAARLAVQARGWRHELVFSHGAEHRQWHSDLRARDVRTYVAPEMGFRAATAWSRRLLAEDPGPTVLHTHFSAWDIPAALAAGGSPDPAVLWHVHTRPPDDWPVRGKQLVRFSLAGRIVDRILCVAPDIRDTVLARLAPSERTQVFPNGIDLVRFAAIGEAERAASRARLGLPVGHAILLMFAWHWEAKGGRLVLETVRELQRRGNQVHAMVVGSETRARHTASRLGLEDVIHPIRPAADARVLYGAADIFISASSGEGMPFALLEAIACGTPVIASDIPGHRFAGGSLPACRLVPRTPSAFADAIAAELATRAPDRSSRLAESRARIARRYSLDTWSERLVALYDEVLPRRSAQRRSLAHTGRP